MVVQRELLKDRALLERVHYILEVHVAGSTTTWSIAANSSTLSSNLMSSCEQ